jgi:AcrR family transcriptional regulator
MTSEGDRGVPGGSGPPVESSPRGARTAARLRTAAREAFAELGWQGTRVEDIVQRAGVSHGTFYTYYENKAAVLADLVRTSQADVVALAADQWAADDVRGALERVIGGFLDLYQRDAVVMRTWLHAAREDPAFGALYLESRALFVDRVADQLTALVAAAGRGNAPPAHTVASALVAMVEHFAYCWAVLGERHDRGDALRALVLVWGSALNNLAGFDVVQLDAAA